MSVSKNDQVTKVVGIHDASMLLQQEEKGEEMMFCSVCRDD